MRHPGSKIHLTSSTDLQARLCVIHEHAEKLRAKPDASEDVKELAYLVAYLTVLVHKNITTGEK